MQLAQLKLRDIAVLCWRSLIERDEIAVTEASLHDFCNTSRWEALTAQVIVIYLESSTSHLLTIHLLFLSFLLHV